MTAPATRSTRHWAQIEEVSFVAGMRFLFGVYRLFGRWPFRIVLYPVLIWYLTTQARARAASKKYLRYIGLPDSFINVLRHFASFGESILDKMLLWGGLFNTDTAVVTGRERLRADIAAGHGGLIICSHFGNLELCRVMARDCPGLKLTVLVHTKHAQAFNRLLGQLDPQSQMNLVQVTEVSAATAMMLAQRVAQGEFVVIAGDRIPVSENPRVATVSFLGEPAPFPVGPYVLASVLQCPVHLMFSMRTGRTSEIHFEFFRESIQLPRKQREEVFTQLAADYAARLEAYCRRAPMQWFNFYDFWATGCDEPKLTS